MGVSLEQGKIAAGKEYNIITLFNGKPEELKEVLREYVKLEEVKFEPLLELFLEVSTDVRRSIIVDNDLRMSLCRCFSEKQKLLLMTSLLYGSFSFDFQGVPFWRDFMFQEGGLYQEKLLPFDFPLCCNQVFLYASYLSGKSKDFLRDTIREGIMRGRVPDIIPEGKTEVECHSYRREYFKIMENMGLDRGKVFNRDGSGIRLVYMPEAGPGEIIKSMALAFDLKGEKKILYFDGSSPCVWLKGVQKYFSSEEVLSGYYLEHYEGMFPWHEE